MKFWYKNVIHWRLLAQGSGFPDQTSIYKIALHIPVARDYCDQHRVKLIFCRISELTYWKKISATLGHGTKNALVICDNSPCLVLEGSATLTSVPAHISKSWKTTADRCLPYVGLHLTYYFQSRLPDASWRPAGVSLTSDKSGAAKIKYIISDWQLIAIRALDFNKPTPNLPCSSSAILQRFAQSL